MVSDSHRVQPFVAHGSPKLPRTAVLLLQPSIATKAVVGAAQHTWHAQYYGIMCRRVHIAMLAGWP